MSVIDEPVLGAERDCGGCEGEYGRPATPYWTRRSCTLTDDGSSQLLNWDVYGELSSGVFMMAGSAERGALSASGCTGFV